MQNQPVIGKRGNFHNTYLIPREDLSWRKKWPRLLDCMFVAMASDDPDYFDAREPGEFAVVDVETKEKAWFEIPAGATPEVLTGMVESHFACSALRVDEFLWVV